MSIITPRAHNKTPPIRIWKRVTPIEYAPMCSLCAVGAGHNVQLIRRDFYVALPGLADTVLL